MRESSARTWGFLPVPLLLAGVAMLRAAVSPTVFYDPAWLVPIANTLFITLLGGWVAHLALRTFRTAGSLQVLLLGSGVLLLGMGAAAAALSRGLPGGANLNATIYDVSALASALCHFVSAALLMSGLAPISVPTRRTAWWLAGYLGALIFAVVLTAAALGDAIPIFFVQGSGPTPIRQWVLGSAAVLFSCSFLLFIGTYRRLREPFLYWYALAMALTAVSLWAFFVQRAVGSPVGWAGRLSQYLSGAYLVLGLVAAKRASSHRLQSFDSVLTFSLSAGGADRAEESARGSSIDGKLEGRLRRIYLEESADAFYVKDLQGRYLMFNAEAGRITGKDPKEVLGKDDTFLFPAGTAESVMTGDRKVMQGRRIVTYEEVVETAAGSATFLSTKGPLFDEVGTVVGLFGIARNVTDLKRAEAALREREYLLSASQQAAHVGTWNWRLNEPRVHWSDELYRIYGLSPDMGPPDFEFFFQIVHPEDRPAMRAWGQACAAGLHPRPVEFRVARPDGGVRYIENSGDVIETVNGMPSRIAGTAHDVTERVLERKALRDSEDRFRKVFDRAQIGIAINRVRGGCFVDANPWFLTWLGYEREEVVGKTSSDLGLWSVPEDRERAVRTMASGAMVQEMEARFRTKDGKERIGVMSSVMITLDDEPSVLSVVRDITERKEAEAALLRSREDLRALAARLDSVREEEKTRLARDLHDEMGQLLTGLRIDLDQIEEMAEALPATPASTALLDRAVDASSLIVRTVAATRSALALLRPAALDRLGLVSALSQECRDFEARTGLHCATELPASLELDADVEIALYRIAQEALTNVARHAAARHVALALEQRPAELVLRVVDDGRGPGDPARSRGLGIIGMKERAGRLGGALTVEVAPSGGTVLTARLPRMAAGLQERGT